MELHLRMIATRMRKYEPSVALPRLQKSHTRFRTILLQNPLLLKLGVRPLVMWSSCPRTTFSDARTSSRTIATKMRTTRRGPPGRLLMGPFQCQRHHCSRHRGRVRQCALELPARVQREAPPRIPMFLEQNFTLRSSISAQKMEIPTMIHQQRHLAQPPPQPLLAHSLL